MRMSISGQDLSTYAQTEYGLEWNKTADTYTRLNAAAGKTRPYFDDKLPFVGMRRCNLSDAGAVLAYYGEPGYAVDGSNGQVMVRIPKFYYRTELTATGYRWFISPVPVPGYKLHPAFSRNGVVKDQVYIGAYEASVYDVTAAATEVDTLTVTAEASASGNITIKLDTATGRTSFAVAVAAGDDANAVATKVRAATFAGWTLSGSGAAAIFTCNATGLKTTATFVDTGTTGVAVSIAKTTSGAGGYTLSDSAGVSFTASTGDKLSSVSGVKPASGANNSLSCTNARVLARNRGTGWEQEDIMTISALQMLMLVEYGGFNSQSLIGNGVTGVTDDGLTNMGVVTGGTNTLGNASGQVAATHYQTGQTANPVSYRGVENLWGNLWKWVDGLSIKADRQPWVADNGFASDQFSGAYANTGFAGPAADGWATDIQYSSQYDYLFLPSAVVGGDSTHYLCDYHWQSAGNRATILGAGWYYGLSGGLFDWYLSNGAGDLDRSVAARLAFVG